MTRIKKLDSETVERIAAGEVVKDPASVVKELLENSLDAGATEIKVGVENGGLDLIRVSDNGRGMDKEDALLAFEKHATSKIEDADDIRSVKTIGFRGEALPSIARVAKVEMVTKSEDSGVGATRVVVEGDSKEVKDAGRGVGTTVEVTDLFYNTPARRKSLRSSKREFSKVSDVVTRYSLTHPGVAFRLEHDRREVTSTPGSGDYIDPIFGVYGREVANRAIRVDHDEDGISVEGAVVRPSVTRTESNHIYTSVNGVAIRDDTVRRGVVKGYGNLLPNSKYPIAIASVSLEPEKVDVNVHPAKKEVRFEDPEKVKEVVRNAVRHTLSSEDLTKISDFDFDKSLTTEGDGETDSRFTSIEVIGQFRDLYLLCESDDDLLVIDQHAAHERVNYEKLLDEFSEGEIESVDLESPESIDLTPAEVSMIEEDPAILDQLGFRLEPFGGGMYRVRGVPAPLGRLQDKEMVHDALDHLFEKGDVEDVRQEILKDVACHPSLKAGDKLTTEEAQELIQELGACDQPFACPHGRPTVITVSEKKLASEFGRESVRFDVEGGS
ncbi:MAG: DNA mismatch repair endonuclease MutL [Halobacteria archaeon]|nr:DNA mismatch repair endonuclease MutL [Halobacteria archaeon]